MKNYLLHLHQQVSDALLIGREFSKSNQPPHVSKILLCAMGGSAISGEILKILFSRMSRIPFEILRDWRLPSWVDRNTFLIFSSYSGNTQEVLQVFDEALRRKLKLLAVTSGGRLAEKISARRGLEIKLPAGIPPRCAIGYLTFSLIQVFAMWRWLKFSAKDFQEVLQILRRSLGEKPRRLARLMSDGLVRFYGLTGLSEPILIRWQSQFAENAKVLTAHHLIPEMLHNEIEGYCLSRSAPAQKFLAVFFRDTEDPPFWRVKIQKVKRLIKNSGSRVLEIHSQGKSLLARLFSLIYLGDWVSYELALLRGTDPLKIPNITALKEARERL